MKNAFDDVILCRGVSKLCCFSVFARNPIFLVTHLQSNSLTLLEVDRGVIDTAIHATSKAFAGGKANRQNRQRKMEKFALYITTNGHNL